MATPSLVESRVEDITKCSICLEDFVSPRSLPCLHTFCLRCLQGHCMEQDPGSMSQCPVCRMEFTIPQNGLQGLAVNFVLQDLIATTTRQASAVKSRVESCEVCSTDQLFVAASVHCIKCEQKLCERCSLPHKKMRGSPHDVRPLGKTVHSPELSPQRSGHCAIHPDKPLELYCFDCTGNVCVSCFLASHRDHRCEELETVARKFATNSQQQLPRSSWESNTGKKSMVKLFGLDFLTAVYWRLRGTFRAFIFLLL